MREKTEIYSIDGKGILAPDANVVVKFSDVEGESARDRSGMLHRTVLRRVRTWEFSYRQLDDEERAYMLGLLTPGTFSFNHPHGKTLCFCRNYRIDQSNAPRAEWENFRFLVEEV